MAALPRLIGMPQLHGHAASRCWCKMRGGGPSRWETLPWRGRLRVRRVHRLHRQTMSQELTFQEYMIHPQSREKLVIGRGKPTETRGWQRRQDGKRKEKSWTGTVPVGSKRRLATTRTREKENPRRRTRVGRRFVFLSRAVKARVLRSTLAVPAWGKSSGCINARSVCPRTIAMANALMPEVRRWLEAGGSSDFGFFSGWK